jgi:hypothetical protein
MASSERGSMRLRRTYLLVALVASATMACPYSDTLIGNNGFAISGGGTRAADVLAFTVQPSNAVHGNIITPAIQVTARDSLGRTDVAFGASITVQILLNPVGGNLSGATTVAPVNGVASFGDLKIDKSGQNYSLQASAPGARSSSSATFTITAQ